MLDIRFLQSVVAGAVAHNAQNIIESRDITDHFAVLVYDGHIIVLLAQLGGQRRSHFSTANNNNLHFTSPV